MARENNEKVSMEYGEHVVAFSSGPGSKEKHNLT
jgi:hypothetical protein